MDKIKPSKWMYVIPFGVLIIGFTIFVIFIIIGFPKDISNEFEAGKSFSIEIEEPNTIGYLSIEEINKEQIIVSYLDNTEIIIQFSQYNMFYELTIRVYNPESGKYVPMSLVNQNSYEDGFLKLEFEETGNYTIYTRLETGSYSVPITLSYYEDSLDARFFLFIIAFYMPYPIIIVFAITFAVIYLQRRKSKKAIETKQFLAMFNNKSNT